jgi:hypothetical protein
MTKRIQDLIKGFSSSSNEEQIEMIRNIRKDRNIDRPSSAKRKIQIEKPAKKKIEKALSSLEKTLQSLSPEQLLILTKKMGK